MLLLYFVYSTLVLLHMQLSFCWEIKENVKFHDPSMQLWTHTRSNIPHEEILCNTQKQEKILDFSEKFSYNFHLNPGGTINSCERYLIPSDSKGLLVQLTRLNQSDEKILNIPKFCPLVISSNGKDSLQWEIDPCSTENVNELWRIIDVEGNIKIFWLHQSFRPGMILTVTKVMQKMDCISEMNMHTCLKIGNEPSFCVAKNLVCDGFRQCPIGPGMINDEDNCRDLYLNHLNEVNFFNSQVVHERENLSNNIPHSRTLRTVNKQHRRETWRYILLGVLICIVALSVLALWICAKSYRKKESNQFENGLRNHEEQFDKTSIVELPPSYSSLFQGVTALNQYGPILKKSECVINEFQPSAPSAPNSMVL